MTHVRVRSTRIGRFDHLERDRFYDGMRRLIEDGKSDLAIARALGISDRTVNRYRRARGIPDIYGRRAA